MSINATGQAPRVLLSAPNLHAPAEEAPSSASHAAGPQPGPFQRLSADLQAVLLQVQQSQGLRGERP